jgi:hypothetical protein
MMMRSLSRSADRVQYESSVTFDSHCMPGVRYSIYRMSFGRRTELARRVLELSQRLEFLGAGETVRDKVEAALTNTEIERLYIQWGLKCIEGLEIDGSPATVESLIQSGPEALATEVVRRIQSESGISEAERKN